MLLLVGQRYLLAPLLQRQSLLLRTLVLRHTLLVRQVWVLQDADIARRWLRLRELLRSFERTALQRLLLFVVTRGRRDRFGLRLLLIYLTPLAIIEVLRLHLLLLQDGSCLFSLGIQ